MDTFPPEQQGAAQTLFGISALIAPVLGPTLGGYIADNYSWEWIFLINVPMGLIAFGLNYWLLEDPEYLKEERRNLRSKPLNFDYIGLGLIVIVMAAMEVVLSKGQEWDWFNDTSWRVQILTAIFAVGLVGDHRLGVAAPGADPEPGAVQGPQLRGVRDRRRMSTFAILYASMTLLPGMLQTLFGYNAEWSGLVMSPAGLFSIPTMAVVGYLIGKQVDARWLIMFGAVLDGGRGLLVRQPEPRRQPRARSSGRGWSSSSARRSCSPP